MSVFERLPPHVEIGLDCLSCQPGQVDTPDVIVDRVEMALMYLPPERTTLNPGLRVRPGAAADVSPGEVHSEAKEQQRLPSSCVRSRARCLVSGLDKSAVLD